VKFALICSLGAVATVLGDAMTVTPEEIAEKNGHGYWQGKSSSASVEKGFIASSAFLYWQAKEDGLEYAQDVKFEGVTGGAPTLIVADTRSEIPEFSWAPGVQVGLGYIFPEQQQWDLSFNWTYFYSKSSSSGVLPEGDMTTHQFKPLWIPFLMGNFASEASAHWTLHYNTFDLALGRNYFVGSWLAFKPSLGLRGALIGQQYNVRYLGNHDDLTFFNSSFKNKNNFGGVGVRVATDLEWLMTSHWSILGNISGSLVYGRFFVRQRADGKIRPAVGVEIDEIFNMRSNITRLIPNFEAKLGLQWNTFFHQEKRRVTLGLFYNLSYWFHQNQLANPFIFFNAATGGTFINELKTMGDLQLQGGSFEARFDF